MSCQIVPNAETVERRRSKALLLQIVAATAHLLASEGHFCAAAELWEVVDWEEEVSCPTPPLRASTLPSSSG